MSQGSGDDPAGGRPPGWRPAPRSGITPPARSSEPRQSRYSRFVSVMKIALPIAALVLLGTVLTYSGLFDSSDKLDVAFREIDRAPADLRMVSPRVAGVTSEGDPYVVTADNATQDPSYPNYVTLENLQADLKLDADKEWMSLSAPGGRYDSETQMLDLSNRVDVFTTWGYEFHGEEATIDFGQGKLTSGKEVKGHGPLGTLRADSMSADRKQQVLRFDGNVKMLILPDGQSEGDE